MWGMDLQVCMHLLRSEAVKLDVSVCACMFLLGTETVKV